MFYNPSWQKYHIDTSAQLEDSKLGNMPAAPSAAKKGKRLTHYSPAESSSSGRQTSRKSTLASQATPSLSPAQKLMYDFNQLNIVDDKATEAQKKLLLKLFMIMRNQDCINNFIKKVSVTNPGKIRRDLQDIYQQHLPWERKLSAEKNKILGSLLFVGEQSSSFNIPIMEEEGCLLPGNFDDLLTNFLSDDLDAPAVEPVAAPDSPQEMTTARLSTSTTSVSSSSSLQSTSFERTQTILAQARQQVLEPPSERKVRKTNRLSAGSTSSVPTFPSSEPSMSRRSVAPATPVAWSKLPKPSIEDIQAARDRFVAQFIKRDFPGEHAPDEYLEGITLAELDDNKSIFNPDLRMKGMQRFPGTLLLLRIWGCDDVPRSSINWFYPHDPANPGRIEFVAERMGAMRISPFIIKRLATHRFSNITMKDVMDLPHCSGINAKMGQVNPKERNWLGSATDSKLTLDNQLRLPEDFGLFNQAWFQQEAFKVFLWCLLCPQSLYEHFIDNASNGNHSVKNELFRNVQAYREQFLHIAQEFYTTGHPYFKALVNHKDPGAKNAINEILDSIREEAEQLNIELGAEFESTWQIVREQIKKGVSQVAEQKLTSPSRTPETSSGERTPVLPDINVPRTPEPIRRPQLSAAELEQLTNSYRSIRQDALLHRAAQPTNPDTEAWNMVRNSSIPEGTLLISSYASSHRRGLSVSSQEDGVRPTTAAPTRRANTLHSSRPAMAHNLNQLGVTSTPSKRATPRPGTPQVTSFEPGQGRSSK